MLRFVHALVFALAAVFGIASGAHALGSETALRRNFESAQDHVGSFASQAFGTRQQNPAVATTIASECSYAARGAQAVIAEGKFGYLFGQASGRAHNVARAAQNAAQMARVGVPNNAAGRALLQSHFDAVVADPSNIVRAFSNQHGSFVVRESLFTGPGGILKFESTWQVLEGGVNRLTTVIPFGGL